MQFRFNFIRMVYPSIYLCGLVSWLAWAHPAPAVQLPTIDPNGEELLEASLLQDALTEYTGGSSLFIWPLGNVIAVNAQKYYQNYEANQISAEQRYSGQNITITGTISSIENDPLQGPYVSFDVGEFGGSVDAFLASDSVAEAATYSRGEVVTLLCDSAGIDLDVPQLRNCDGLGV